MGDSDYVAPPPTDDLGRKKEPEDAPELFGEQTCSAHRREGGMLASWFVESPFCGRSSWFDCDCGSQLVTELFPRTKN